MTYPSRPISTRAFTLVEVMISVAIVLLLVAGINLIFNIATKTVGATQAMNANSRSNQAAQLVMTEDFKNCVTDVSMPYLIIYSKATPAFRNLDDMHADRDYDATIANTDTRAAGILTVDLDNNNTEGETTVAGEVITPVTVNNRNHRTDIVSFFSKGRNYRRTGNPGTYQASQFSDESLIWYGHLSLPDNSGTFNTTSGAMAVQKTAPGAGTFGGGNNPNNVFASQWTLGRESILLTKADASGFIYDANNTAQSHAYDSASPPWTPNGLNQYPIDTTVNSTPALQPLQFGSPMSAPLDPGATAITESIQFSRIDLADTSIDLFRTRLSRFIASTSIATTDWWSRMMATDNMRFCADPFVSKPLTSSEFAKTSPIFLSNCSQFIVEFAGDFMTQGSAAFPDSDAITDATKPDGQIDYISEFTSGTLPPVKKIRWYGFPRNTETANDSVGVQNIPGTRVSSGAFDANHDNRLDVIPVRDAAQLTGGAHYSFERNSFPADTHNILDRFNTAPLNYETAGVLPNSYYVCAWGPNDALRPSLIRITLTLDDPNGRLPDGSTFEYIFHVKN